MLLLSIRKTDPQLSRSYLRSMVLLLLLLFSSWVISNSCDPVDCSPPGSSIRGISQQKHWSEKKKKERNTGVGCRFLLQLIVIRWCLLWGHILEYALHLAVAIVQSLSRVQLFATLQIAAPPGFPVLHNLPEFAQIHVYWVHRAIQPSHPLPPPSPPAFNLSQHQGLFKWVSSSHQVTKGLELQFQHILLTLQHLNPSLWPSGNQMPSQWVMYHSALYWSREISSPGQCCVWEDRQTVQPHPGQQTPARKRFRPHDWPLRICSGYNSQAQINQQHLPRKIRSFLVKY